MSKVPFDLFLTLSRANLRGIGLPILALPVAWLYLIKAERAATSHALNSYQIPYIDGLFHSIWSSMQTFSVQMFLVPCLMLFAGLYLCDRSVRHGNRAALAVGGALGTVVHFVNLPFLVHLATYRLYDLKGGYELDKAPGFVGGLDFLASFFGAAMQVRIDPLAWPYPSDPSLIAVWWLMVAFWALTLVVSASALALGLSHLMQGRDGEGRVPVAA